MHFARVHSVLRGVVNGGCNGTVLLDNELWQSLTAMNGHEVPWVYGCVLDHGHDAEHGAQVHHVDGEPQQWLRWSDGGPARLEHVEPSAPGRHAKPHGSPGEPPAQSTTASGSPLHRRGGGEATATGADAAALWAVAAAIERLADAVARLRNPPRDTESTDRAPISIAADMLSLVGQLFPPIVSPGCC